MDLSHFQEVHEQATETLSLFKALLMWILHKTGALRLILNLLPSRVLYSQTDFKHRVHPSTPLQGTSLTWICTRFTSPPSNSTRFPPKHCRSALCCLSVSLHQWMFRISFLRSSIFPNSSSSLSDLVWTVGYTAQHCPHSFPVVLLQHLVYLWWDTYRNTHEANTNRRPCPYLDLMSLCCVK